MSVGAPVAAIPVVVNESHRGYAPPVEIAGGAAIKAFDSVERIDRILASMGEDEGSWDIRPATEHGREPILKVHDPALIDFLENAWDELGDERPAGVPFVVGDTFLHERLRAGMGPRPAGRPPQGIGAFCYDTYGSVGPETFESALGSVDAALTAVDLVVAGAPMAAALCRPPGHHVSRDLFGGGCYLNNAAIAAQAVLDSGFSSVAIVDIDTHHGNGTQSLFYDRSDVFFGSLHADPAYSYPFHLGWPEEEGIGEGVGANRNILLPREVDGDTYLALLGEMLGHVADFGAQALVVSLGVDTEAGDPSGDGRLTAADFTAVGRALGGLDLPSVLVLEGGYEIERMGSNFTSCVLGVAEGRRRA